MEKKNLIKKILAIVLSTAMVLSINANLCTTVLGSVTSPNAVTYRYYDPGTTTLKTNTLEANTYNVVDTTASWNSSDNNGWYVVTEDVTITDRVTVTGDIKLVLTDEHTLTCSSGIEVAGENTLTIYGQEKDTGTLTATAPGAKGWSGIGTGSGKAGTITIDGGTINATGSSYRDSGSGLSSIRNGAGIGVEFNGASGATAESGNTIINGGYINTNGGSGWAGGQTVTAPGISSIISTGAKANAIVKASSILNTANSNNWYGIFFNGNAGTVYRYASPVKDFTINTGETLTIPSGSTLCINSGLTLTNNGTLTVSDQAIISAYNITNNNVLDAEAGSSVVISNEVINTNFVTINGQFTCKGNFNNSKLITINENGLFTCNGGTNTGMINNKGEILNSGIISGDDGYIISDSDVADAGGQLLRNVNYINEQGELTTIPADSAIHPVTTTDTTWQKDDEKSTWYIVPQDTTVGGISLSDDINLLLLDGATLTVNGCNGNGGINAANHTINIYAQSTGANMGKIIATSGHENWQAIGGSNAAVNIYGGSIDTTDTNAKSGIGCGAYQNCGKITITSGLIKTNSIGYKDSAVGTNTAGLYAPEGSNAIIYTEQTSLGSDTASTFHGILFLAKSGTVYGDQELSNSLMIGTDETLTIPEGTTLTIPEGDVLTVNGELDINGSLVILGTLSNNNIVKNNGTIYKENDTNIEGNDITGNGNALMIIDTVAVTGVDSPTAGLAFDKSATVDGKVNSPETVKYYVDGSEITDENADYNTTYTAEVTLTPNENYGFADVSVVTFNGMTPTSTTLNNDGTLTVTYTFATTVPMTLPIITTQPTAATVVEGTKAIFTVAATGTPAPEYQWQIMKDTTWEDIDGATSASYTTSATVKANNGYKYRCVVTNYKGNVTSNEAILTVNDAPVAPTITKQPENTTVQPGNPVTFKADTTGTDNTFQWYVDKNDGKGYVAISGATYQSYTVTSPDASCDGYKYKCAVTNSVGTVETTPVTLTVKATTPAKVNVRKITLTGISKNIAAGKSIKLSATVAPANASNKKLTWKSSDTKVATVNASGKVTIKKNAGGKKVTITAKAKDGSGVAATYKITVTKGVVRKISVSGAKSLKAGKTLKLKAKVTASKGANKKLIWTSSNKKYATVSATGKVKAFKAGKGKTVKITVMSTDGSSKKKTVNIKIK